jgi:hypothetical protein
MKSIGYWMKKSKSNSRIARVVPPKDQCLSSWYSKTNDLIDYDWSYLSHLSIVGQRSKSDEPSNLPVHMLWAAMKSDLLHFAGFANCQQSACYSLHSQSVNEG